MNTPAFNPCVVVPVYNHPASLLSLAQTIANLRLAAWFVDDGSNGPTQQALAVVAGLPGVTVLRHEANRGKGAACITGLRAAFAAGRTHAVQIDADGQHDPALIPQFIAAAQAAPTALILGTPRYDASVPRVRRYGRYLTHGWVWIETLSLAIKDSLCGFRVYPLAATCHLLDTTWIGRGMDFDSSVAVQLCWAGLPIRNLPTPVTYPPGGISHFRPWADNVRLSVMHTRLVAGMLCRLPRLLARTAPDSPSPADGWLSLRERGSLLGLQLTLLIYRVLGRRVCRWLVAVIVTYFWLTGSKARRASRGYLERLYAMPQGRVALGHPPTGRDTYRHFREYGEALLDRFSAWMHDLGKGDVEMIGTDPLLAHHGRKEGVILVSAHWGNAEVIRAIAHNFAGLRVNALMLVSQTAKFNRVLRQVNRAAGVNVIATDEVTAETAIMLNERLAAGELLALQCDRLLPGSSARTYRLPFLGQETAFPQGPFILASLLDRPVYLISCRRLARDRYQVVAELLAATLAGPRAGREAYLLPFVQRYVAHLEKLCYAAPYQWFNFYDFWR